MFAQIKLYLYGAVAVALVTGFLMYRHSLILVGEQKIEAAVSAANKKAEEKRAADLAALAKADAAIIQKIQESYNAQIAYDHALADTLARQLQDYEVRSRAAALPGDPATHAGPDVPAGKPSGVDEAVAGVIEAAGRDAAKVTALQEYIGSVCLK
jgi:hypothetical protein